MTISIFRKGLLYEILIDNEDWDKIKDIRLRILKQDNDKFRVAGRLKGSKKTFYLHRFIMNASINDQVDHIDGNPLNNKKENLRICSNKENSKSQSIRKRNTSGYKGVTWDKQRSKWKAQITINYKHKSLGFFNSKEDAALCYNEGAIKYFGEFALLNIIK